MRSKKYEKKENRRPERKAVHGRVDYRNIEEKDNGERKAEIKTKEQNMNKVGNDMAETKKKSRKKKDAPKVDAELVETPKKKQKGKLIPLTERSPEEARAIRAAGGKASAEAQRKKRELRSFAQRFLMQDATMALKQNMSVLGVEEDDMTNLAAMVVRVFSKAVNQGDLNAARTLIEWAGMAPLQQEQENAAIAKMAQVMQLASGKEEEQDDVEDVVFYIPDNGRPIVKEDLVTVGDGNADRQ